MKLRVSKQKISATMLISMTDVIFLLLLFLLITSNFVSQTGLPVKLPGSSTGIRQSNQPISITYYRSGQVFLMDKETNLKSLEQELRSLYRSPDQVVRISAEQDLQVQSLILLMDVVRSSGFEKIFVATTPIQKKP